MLDFRDALGRGLIASAGVVGRRRFLRASEFVVRAARLDVPNEIARNGELLVQAAALARGGNEPLEIMDVGAHYGEWSSSLLAQVPDKVQANVHLFEPSQYTHAKLAAELAETAGITLNRIALSDRQGHAELQVVHRGAGSNSLENFASDGREARSTEVVPITTVDEYAREHDLTHVELLKIDAEGHDLAVIAGAGPMLARRAISCVQFEYNKRWIPGRRLLLDAFELLEPLGYSLGKVTPLGVQPYGGWHVGLETFTEGNYVAFLPEFGRRLPRVDSR